MDKSKVLYDLGTMCDTMAHDFFNPVHLRYTVTLDHDIDDELIKKAWDRTKRVYPIIDGVFGFDSGDASFYLNLRPEEREKYLSDHIYVMKAEGGVNNPVKTKVPVVPATDIVGGRVICISYYERTVSINAYHMLVDGSGLNAIFCTFLYSYLALYTGHEDRNPVVELREGREIKDYYIPASSELVFSQEYTPVPLYTLPLNCKGFDDEDMVNDGNNIYCGNVSVSAADFMQFCKENGANPSSMICTLLAKAAYALNPDETNDMIFGLTISVKKMLGIEDSIANAVGSAIAYTTRDAVTNNTIAEVSQKIRSEINTQRTKDQYISHFRTFCTYRYGYDFKPRTVTYIGGLNIGDNNKHIVDFNMETNGRSNLYLMQLNDRFILTLQYGMATQKYLNEFNRIFTELGIKSEISHPAHHVLQDSMTAVL